MCVLDDKNKLYESGYLGTGCNKSQFTEVKNLKEPVELVSVSHYNIWVLLKDQTLWYKGESRSYNVPENSGKSDFTQHKIWAEKEKEEKIVDICSAYQSNFFVTEQGKLWGRGETMTSLLGQESSETVEIKLPKD